MADTPWNDAERLELFGEIIKAARVPPMQLFAIIQNTGAPPNWPEMPLPRGRSYNSCIAEYEKWTSGTGTVPPSSATGPQFSHFALREGQILGANRHTQPTTGGYAGYSGTTGVSYSTPAGGMTPESKRKRGRPTKLESEARRQAAMARGEPYPMPKTNSSDPARPSVVGQNNTPSRPAPIQEPRIMNQDAMDDDNSPGSTGKRKRGRPSKQTSSLIHMSPLGQPDESPITGETQHTYNQEAVQASLQGRTEYESVSAENVSMMNMMKPAGQSNSPSLGSHQHRQLSNVHGLEGSGMMQ